MPLAAEARGGLSCCSSLGRESHNPKVHLSPSAVLLPLLLPRSPEVVNEVVLTLQRLYMMIRIPPRK